MIPPTSTTFRHAAPAEDPMRSSRRFLAFVLVTCLAACGDSPPTSPGGTPPAATPQLAMYEVSGTVFETVDGVSRPRADQSVSLTAVQNGGSPSSVQYLTTDGNGRYSARVPRSQVFVSAVW